MPVVNNYPAESDLPHTIVITELPEQTIVDEIFLEKPGKNLVQPNSAVTAFPVFPTQSAETPVAGLTLVTDAATEVGSHEIKIPPAPKTIGQCTESR